MNERFLPIGTVVLLKGGTKEVMITAYGIFPTQKEYSDGKEVKLERKIYEYGGCVYPEGILNSDTACAFNHNQIEKVLFMGYVTDQYKEFSKKLNEDYEKIKSQFENDK